MCGFAENYSFTWHDETQWFHWNNAHATLQASVIYFPETPTAEL
jgi:hypothetical protein